MESEFLNNQKSQKLTKSDMMQPGEFDCYPSRLLALRLTPAAVVVALALLADIKRDQRACTEASYNELARQLGIGKTTVMRAVSALQNAGVLAVDSHNGGVNFYEFFEVRNWHLLADKKTFNMRTSAKPTSEPIQIKRYQNDTGILENDQCQNDTAEQSTGIESTPPRYQNDTGTGIKTIPPRYQNDTAPIRSNNCPKKTKITKRKSDVFLDKFINENFERFWKIYPRKISISKSLKLWETILKKSPAENREKLASEIINGVLAWMMTPSWKKNLRQRKIHFIPHPTTWLNGERWKAGEIQEFMGIIQTGKNGVFENERTEKDNESDWL